MQERKQYKMRIFIQAKPSAKEQKIEKIDETHFKVWVKEPPIQGKANYAILEALAKYFNTSKSHLKIISSWTSKQKIIDIRYP